ncbi:MAG: ChbG/HpnK family deacetylase [Gammaproteobacteria bacterium]|nr:ChbG/HpnK family deacetylase [Gammaproteobacteria bacterium]
MNTTSERQPAYLIVNADDYGYFDCVSRGILESARHGIVTATGIFATSANFNEHAGRLADVDSLDIGVHLNITDQAPLTAAMRKKLSRWAGQFPGKYTVARAVLSGAISSRDVKLEWQAQIERCLEQGLNIAFLNSHEHIHMLPSLFPVVQELAAEYDILHVRFPTSELFRDLAIGAVIRDVIMKVTGLLNRRRCVEPTAHFLGMGNSGKLTVEYLLQRLPGLKPGGVYELMCHPGFADRSEISDPRLLQYHNWNGEREALTNPEVRDMLKNNGIRLIGYRHLEIQGTRLTVCNEAE